MNIRIILLFLLVNTVSYAYTAFVKEDANIRLNPNVKSEKVNVLKKGKQVDILKKYGSWYQIASGYISKELVTIPKKKVSKNREIESIVPFECTGTLTSNSKVRSEPSLKGALIKILKKGIKINIINKIKTTNNGIWYETSIGYIFNTLVFIDEDIIEKQIEDKNETKIVDGNITTKLDVMNTNLNNNKKVDIVSTVEFKRAATVVEDANVRIKPNRESKKVKILRKDTVIDILNKIFTKEHGKWYEIQQGYISPELVFIKDTNKTLFDSNDVKAKKVLIAKDANIRKLPSVKSNIVKSIESGTRVEVIDKVYEDGFGLWYETPEGYISEDLVDENMKQNEQKLDPNISNKIKNKTIEKDTKIHPKQNIVPYKKPHKKLAIKKIKKRKKEQKKEKEATKIVSIKKPIVINKVIKKEIITKNSVYFFALSLHQNSLDVKQNDKVGSIILPEPLDDSASSFKFQLGTYIKNKYIASANYEILNINSIEFSSYYVSLDYLYKAKFNPYIGASIGMSDLQWQTDPLVNSVKKDSKLSSLMYGLQAGIVEPLDDKWSFFSEVSYQKFDFTTQLTSGSAQSEIKHSGKFSLGVGIKYAF